MTKGRIGAVDRARHLEAPALGRSRPRAVITGGAGFVGANLADRLAREGQDVLIYDSLCRPGVETNAAWLKERHGDRIAVEIADVRDAYTLRDAVRRATRLFHLSAQVAVTTSLLDPALDFEVNARGTLNLLEALRSLRESPPLVFSSTNKVYGRLLGMEFDERGLAYVPQRPEIEAFGIGEEQPLDFCSPYGCSKGSADQYVLDYARLFGLPATVFRMSCIYGPRQLGTEDQGWVAHFLRQVQARQPITIYGDGKQVRDLLFVDDLIEAMLLAQTHMADLQAQAFNIGGGPSNAVSLLEVLELIGRIDGRSPAVEFGPWRAGDQVWYVSDIRRFGAATGWVPRVDVRSGIDRLWRWLQSQTAPRLQPAKGAAA